MVVYVHGLWHRGTEALWLRRRLARDLMAETCAFTYPSVRNDVATNARALSDFLQGISADTVHIVAHSLGGLVTLELFERWITGDTFANGSRLPPGRVVLLGSPVRGSLTAQRLAQIKFGKKILGATVNDVLLSSRLRRWNSSRELGVLAGDLGFGLGRLVGRLDMPNDGTVLVEETFIEGATDCLSLRVSHSGMVFSARLAEHVAAFLQYGRFQPTT